ncbi:GABA-specific permease [Histoplasma capsulatum H143]|uniref:GABA-specific permease n=1 Tax=Ajellomyces capsulatus (strain H143) TaxID=544712 RepID=C6H1E1_AJECH|nr:GABA-specific permease [Histoplasma capsulatum H143]
MGDGCLGPLWILDFRNDDSQTYPSEIFSNEIFRQTVNQPYHKVESKPCLTGYSTSEKHCPAVWIYCRTLAALLNGSSAAPLDLATLLIVFDHESPTVLTSFSSGLLYCRFYSPVRVNATIMKDTQLQSLEKELQGSDEDLTIFGDSELAESFDADILATMGYKQELERRYSSLQIFSIAFSIMGLLPSIAATLPLSLPAGPVGMVWGWFIACGFIFVVGLAIADLASSLPTSGGLYWWTHYFAPEKFRRPLSFLVGYSNAIGLIGGTCSVDYGFALMLLSIPSIVSDGKWTASSPVVYGVFAGCVIAHAIVATFASKYMNKIQMAVIVGNVTMAIATIIALPVGKSRSAKGLNSASYVFTHQENHTAWPAGWAFMLAWLSPIWTIGGIDSCVHMSEEAKNASKAVPRGILGSISGCWLLGFITVCVIALSMDPNVEALIRSPLGQPMAQLIAASRQSWAFSRDGGLPFSSFFRVLGTRIHYRSQPIRTVWGCAFSAMILGLICLVNTTAAKALFSLGPSGNAVAWLYLFLPHCLGKT